MFYNNYALTTINKQIEALDLLKNTINDQFFLALDLIKNCKGKIIISGMGKSGHIGNKIAATLASTGTPAFFLHPAEASHGDLGMISAADLLILISNSGETKELSDIIYFCKRLDINIIGITSKSQSTLAKASTVALILPDYPENNSVNAPIISTTLTLVLGDCLAVSLLEDRNFNKEQFNNFHPGGKLGLALKRVADIMRVGNHIPAVDINQTMDQVLLEMTSKHLGCVAVLNNNLVGIITDGDLRRNFCNDFLHKKAQQIMTKNPITITSQTLAVEAINLMNKKNITNLFVVNDNNQLVGVLHLHDCLKIGIS